MSWCAFSSFATPGSKTRPGLFGETPVMFVGPNVLPGLGGSLDDGSVYAMMWCTFARAVGLISTAVYQRSSGRFIGIRMYLYSIVPVAGTLKSSVIEKIASGLPMPQPSANAGNFGMSAMSPFGAPPSIHETIVAISWSDSRGSLRNMPCGISDPHGGIVRAVTRVLIARSHGRASSYDVNENGANIVAR